MKKTLIALSLLLLAAHGYAQKVIFYQDFNKFNSYQITGWNTKQYTGKAPWQAGELYDINNDCLGAPLYPKIAGVCDCTGTGSIGGGGANHNVFMFTPKIDLKGVNGAWLKFDSYFRKASAGGKTEKATVEISTNGGANWTVLKDLPANTNIKQAEEFNIDLSAYNNDSVRIGFRYNDDGLNVAGWAVDNVKVSVPAAKDLTFASLTPHDTLLRYVALGKEIAYGGQVYNSGLDTVFSYIVHYRQAANAVKSDTITGVAIPAFARHHFNHKIPDTAFKAGNTPVTVWVELLGDSIRTNDTLVTDIRGSYFTPKKRLVIEEGTGTWSEYSPLGWVYMNQVRDSAWDDVTQISVHSGDSDPMTLENYDDYLFNLDWNYVPYFLFDRHKRIAPDSFYHYLNVRRNYFGFADVDFDYANYGNELIINAHVKPAIDMEGDFRFVLVLTEDNVNGIDSGYRQRNRYAGGVFGPMGGFENKPYNVPPSDMHYNFVARTAAPSPEGTKGLLPSKLVHNTDYTHAIKTTLDPSWNKERLKLIVLLIRNDDSTILNSNKSLFYLDIKKPEVAFPDMSLYPNPAHDIANIRFKVKHEEEVSCVISDLSGKQLLETKVYAHANESTLLHLPVSNLTAGLYLVTLSTSDYKKTIKMNVIH